ncbi:MAG TPA: hypothetical protein VFJ16_11930 [Longimicrobium sp.]|nr:hypothetical protein [Longimicrobium sp.]
MPIPGTTALRGLAITACAALALGGCRDRKPPPGQGQPPPAAPPAAGQLDLTVRLPDQPPWNASDTVLITVQNASQAAVPDAVVDLFAAAGLAMPVDSSAASRPESTVDASGTRLRFAIGTVGAGQTIELKQAIHTPPAPAPPAAPPAPGQPPAQPKPRIGTPAARTDTATRFVVRVSLLGRGGAQLAPPVTDTLRIRPESAVTVGGCGNVSDAVVTRYGIGPVRVGMPLDALRSACPEARDTTWKGQEGAAEAGLVVLPGGRRVVAVTAGGAVERIVIDQPGLKTATGAGVGSKIGDLRSSFGRMCTGAGERQVAVWFPNQPGISFGLDTAATRGWTPARMNPDSVPDTVAVGRMWVRRGSDDCPALSGEGTR